MKNNVLETLMGAVVLAITAGFIIYAYQTAGIASQGGASYELTARFTSASGLAPGADVRVSGVRVGSVYDLQLDPENYEAEVVLSLGADVRLPEDTSARIASDGLLGRSYITLEPGGAEDMLAAGDEISITSGSVSLMNILGQAILNFGGGNSGQ